MLTKSSPTYKSNSARQRQSKMTPKSAHTGLDELNDDGAFKRSDAAWRDWISKGEN
jgi:hypothetical protein